MGALKKLAGLGAAILIGVITLLVLAEAGLLPGGISRIIPRTYLDISVTSYDAEVWQVTGCEVNVMVQSTGGNPATGVMVHVTGFGQNKSASFGTLNPGESETARFLFWAAVRGGDHTFVATATSNEGASDTYTFTVHVRGI